MGNLKDMAQDVRGDLIPQFPALRRVPTRYQRVLPLKMMKQYHCVVVGAAQGVLTVAIIDRYDTFLIEFLSKITGYTIFPVVIDSARMRTLIEHMEVHERRRYNRLKPSCFLHPRQAHAIVALLP